MTVNQLLVNSNSLEITGWIMYFRLKRQEEKEQEERRKRETKQNELMAKAKRRVR